MDRETLELAKKLGTDMQDHINKQRIRISVGGIKNDYTTKVTYDIGCYGILSYGYPEGMRALVAPVSHTCDVSDEVTNLFYNWLINDSYFAKVFVNTTVASISKYGFICRTNVPANLLVGALMLARWGWTTNNKGQALMLVLQKKQQLTMLERILFLQNISQETETKFHVNAYNSFGTFSISYMSKTWYQNFLKNSPDNLLHTFAENTHYTNSTDIFRLFDKDATPSIGSNHQPFQLNNKFNRAMKKAKLIKIKTPKNSWGNNYREETFTDLDGAIAVFKELLKSEGLTRWRRYLCVEM